MSKQTIELLEAHQKNKTRQRQDSDLKVEHL